MLLSPVSTPTFLHFIQVHEFVRGLEPLNESLVLWRDLAVGNGPFHRVEHTLVRFGIPSESHAWGSVISLVWVKYSISWDSTHLPHACSHVILHSKQVALRLRV
jgi:hypothetical protein